MVSLLCREGERGAVLLKVKSALCMPSPAHAWGFGITSGTVISAHLCLEEKPHHRAAGVQGWPLTTAVSCWNPGRVRSLSCLCLQSARWLLDPGRICSQPACVCRQLLPLSLALSAGFRHALGCGAQVATGLCLLPAALGLGLRG